MKKVGTSVAVVLTMLCSNAVIYWMLCTWVLTD